MQGFSGLDMKYLDSNSVTTNGELSMHLHYCLGR
jgi:hypothetical protein